MYNSRFMNENTKIDESLSDEIYNNIRKFINLHIEKGFKSTYTGTSLGSYIKQAYASALWDSFGGTFDSLASEAKKDYIKFIKSLEKELY